MLLECLARSIVPAENKGVERGWPLKEHRLIAYILSRSSRGRPLKRNGFAVSGFIVREVLFGPLGSGTDARIRTEKSEGLQ
jgi:hypothetical protein